MLEIYLLDVSDMTEEKFNNVLDGLSERRRARALGYVNIKDGNLSAGAGYLLDCALKKYGLTEKNVEIVLGGHGKPYFKKLGLFFSLSHSGDIAVCALSDGEVGADVQKIKTPTDALIKRVCSESEIKSYNSLKEDERGKFFTRLWTAKESYLKFTGEGIDIPLRDLSVSLTQPIKIVRQGETQAVNFAEYGICGYAVSVCAKVDYFPPTLKKITL